MKKTMIYQMNETERAERARVKALHQASRAAMHEAAKEGGQRHRYALLAWAYLRGLPFRRIERSHHVQVFADGRRFEHNLPCHVELARALAPFCPEIAAGLERYSIKRGSVAEKRIAAWLNDPSGAIPAPPPRQKKPYAREKISSRQREPVAAE